MSQRKRRKISAGTLIMLTVSLATLAVTIFVLTRLSSGISVDLTRLRPDAVDLDKQSPTVVLTEQPVQQDENPVTPALTDVQSVSETVQRGKSYTLTVGGTVALAGEVRTNSYYSDVKQYDYYDIMTLLRKELKSDLNIVFLENILSTDEKSSDVIATGAAASMMKAAGINAAACGFSKAFDKAESGIQSTRKLLTEYGIQPLGVYEGGGRESICITEINGIRTALLQYTETIPTSTRKTMVKKEQSAMIPPADDAAVAADIDNARKQGCEAVIVLLQWGKTGKDADRSQRALAQKIADAGADLIVGCGSRIVSGAEILTAESGRNVPCVWSLGTVLSGDRSNIKRIAGILLHVTVITEDGKTEIRNCSYTPLYTWKYKMDGRYYYRCLAANGTVPDGMDSDQQKSMKKAADTIREAMKNSGMEEQGIE